jgi:23S rRNA pseudouridine2457 synthase
MGYQYILFHKPYNVLSQFSDGSTPAAADASHRLTLKDFIALADVYPVGRLDRDSEGLMLLTDHGQVQHRLSDPRFAHPRTYWVQVEHLPLAPALAQLCQGVTIKGYRTRPCQAKLLLVEPDLPPREPPIRDRRSIPTAWLELTLHEGKNRQVRRMTAAVGHPTLRLVRVAIAHLELGSLQPGQWRPVTSIERQRLLRL